MDSATQGFAILLICWLLLLVHLARKAWTSRLRSLPGPLAGRFSGFFRVWLLSTGRGPLEYCKLHKKYGPVVRTGPNHVSLSDPAIIPVIYDLKGKFFKSHFYDVFKPLYRGTPMDTIFTTSNPVDKKVLKHSLITSMTSCPQESQRQIKQSVDKFVLCMHDTRGQSVNFFNWPFFWAFDMTFAIIFGSHFGFMESGSDFNNMIDSFIRIVRPAALLGQVPEWCPFLLGNNTFMTTMRKFRNFPDPTQMFLEEIEKRIESHNQTPHNCSTDLLCKVLGDRNSEKNDVGHHETVNILFETFFAAAVESAVTIRTIFYCLLTHDDVYSRLTRKIRHDEAHSATRSVDSQEELLTLPYLNAVIKECLRLYSSTCPPMERIVPSPGIEANGYYIPEGTVVSVAHDVTHRDPAVFGEDAGLFRPERWLETDPSTLKRMNDSFMAFGKGNRGCIGRELAMSVLRVFIIEVLSNFDIEWASKNPRPEIKMYWIIEQFDLNIKFRDLKHSNEVAHDYTT